MWGTTTSTPVCTWPRMTLRMLLQRQWLMKPATSRPSIMVSTRSAQSTVSTISPAVPAEPSKHNSASESQLCCPPHPVTLHATCLPLPPPPSPTPSDVVGWDSPLSVIHGSISDPWQSRRWQVLVWFGYPRPTTHVRQKVHSPMALPSRESSARIPHEKCRPNRV